MINYIKAQENLTGASASGVSGATNRVITLANATNTRQPGFLVTASGLILALTNEYTVVHQSSGTTITFLNGLWDDMNVVVDYYKIDTTIETPDTTELGTKRTDFQSIVNDHGQTGTLIRQTNTVDSMGGTTAVSEARYTIITVLQDILKKDRRIHEMGLAIPGNIKAFFYHEYPNSITENGTVSVQEGDIFEESDSKRWRVVQILGERHMDGGEVFRTGILRNVGLDS